ncbi:putative memrbane protein [Clostridium bornimense]|uniref:Putative memrbane protein n=1 Tax=Clostridium bornimense TaxID=1216932 RepID=W6SFN6_9CLOT|nr:PilN domain-containing protein [Clostridium bornimense]CDM68495.1 putative memrbane protein [Clostridium bornimense]
MIKQLNLNPEVINKSLKVNALDKKLKQALVSTVLVVALVSVAALGINLFIIAKIKVLEISANKYDDVIQENKKLTAETNKMNSFISQIDSIKSTKTNVSKILKEVSGCIPNGGSIDSYNIDDGKSIKLSYSTKEYDDITKFMKNVEDTDFFESINISSISSDSNGFKASVEIEVSSKNGEE